MQIGRRDRNKRGRKISWQGKQRSAGVLKNFIGSKNPIAPQASQNMLFLSQQSKGVRSHTAQCESKEFAVGLNS